MMSQQALVHAHAVVASLLLVLWLLIDSSLTSHKHIPSFDERLYRSASFI